jgi:succinate-semialdehyde dehydrogenase / glutarate-semialdehyde dehydrogenase
MSSSPRNAVRPFPLRIGEVAGAGVGGSLLGCLEGPAARIDSVRMPGAPNLECDRRSPLRVAAPLHPPAALRRRSLADAAGVVERGVLRQVPRTLLIGSGWRNAAGGHVLAVEDPATGAALCEVADGSEADALAALGAAAGAQPEWAATAPVARAAILRRAAASVEADRERLALLLTLETGKPLPEARAEVSSAAEHLSWNADEALRVGGRIGESPDGRSRLLVMHRPVGPALAIVPWNFPLLLAARALAPALAAGCAVVLRPSALTPLATLWLARLMRRAGVPAGVLNVIVSSTDAVTDPLLDDPRLAKLSFTGSTQVGRMLLARCARRMLRTTLELGGHAPFVVFADADLDDAVAGALAGKTRNAGQVCTSPSRFYVQRPLAERFTARLADAMRHLRLGRGTDPRVEMGPLISAEQRDRVHGLVQDALARGARLVCGGEPLPGPGHFYRPTVLTGVPADARLMREEIFGPIAPVVAFEREDEAIRLANESDYGLAGYLYTRDLERALRVGEALEVGMVGLNRPLVASVTAPFGGCKQSGLGRAGGAEGISEYLETHYLAIDSGEGR